MSERLVPNLDQFRRFHAAIFPYASGGFYSHRGFYHDKPKDPVAFIEGAPFNDTEKLFADAERNMRRAANMPYPTV